MCAVTYELSNTRAGGGTGELNGIQVRHSGICPFFSSPSAFHYEDFQTYRKGDRVIQWQPLNLYLGKLLVQRGQEDPPAILSSSSHSAPLGTPDFLGDGARHLGKDETFLQSHKESKYFLSLRPCILDFSLTRVDFMAKLWTSESIFHENTHQSNYDCSWNEPL